MPMHLRSEIFWQGTLRDNRIFRPCDGGGRKRDGGCDRATARQTQPQLPLAGFASASLAPSEVRRLPSCCRADNGWKA